MRMKAFSSLVALLLVSAQGPYAAVLAEDVEDPEQTYDLPKGVTICDGSDPIGEGAAFLVPRPIPYCMNNGVCKKNYMDSLDEPCRCRAGFTGPHCEFEEGTEPRTCNLHCFSGGTCQIGAKSFEIVLNQYTDASDLQYCLCPPGKSGRYCEQDSLQCGDFYCFNGGKCVTIEQVNGTAEHHCDCTTTYTGSNAFAGQFCQHKATAICSNEPDYNGHQFCVNGGKCRQGRLMGCDCPEGFIGPLCEFQDMEIEYSECTMKCHNGGVCRKGAKDTTFLEKFDLHRRDLLGAKYNEDFEHCVCPRGFVGLSCEYEMDVCPGYNHVCMHGGQCKILAGNGMSVDLQCDCTSAQSGQNRYAGKFCEAQSTDFCTIDGQMPQDGPGYDAFCTNGGECTAIVEDKEDFPGCACQEDFYGAHCEMVKEPVQFRGRVFLENQEYLIIVIAGGVAVLCLAFIAYLVYRRNKRNREERRIVRRSVANGGYTDSITPPPPTLDHINKLESNRTYTYGVGHDDDDSNTFVSTNKNNRHGIDRSTLSNARFHESSEAFAIAKYDGQKVRSNGSATNVGSDYSVGSHLSLSIVKL